MQIELTLASFALLTPYPGTALYRRLRAEGRLTDPRWWLRRDHDAGSPYFEPARMSREELREGWVRAWKRFYAPGAVWDRFTIRRRSSWIQSLAFVPINLMQQRLVRRKIEGGMQRFRAGVPVEDRADDRLVVDETLTLPADLLGPDLRPGPVGRS